MDDKGLLHESAESDVNGAEYESEYLSSHNTIMILANAALALG
jgi:hypothetical protein